MNLLSNIGGQATLLATLWALASAASYAEEEMEAAFVDAAWTGEGIPDGQQCQRFGGNDPKSPALQLDGVPESAEAVVLEFSDRTFARMDKGGHGKVGYRIAKGQRELSIPSVPGHSEELPENFFVVAMHRAPGWDKAGAYLPPCSGGRGNEYFIDIKAVTLDDEGAVADVLSETSIKMATY